MKTINDFIKELNSLSEENKKKGVIIFAPNGLAFKPVIKFIGEHHGGRVENKMCITYE